METVQARCFLNVVVRNCAVVRKLLTGQDETLLVGRDTFFVLNLGLDVVALVHFVLDSLASECVDEDLHATTETVQARCLLSVAVRECAAARKLLTDEDETLLV